jgi:integrase
LERCHTSETCFSSDPRLNLPMPCKPRSQRKPPVSLTNEQFLALLAKAQERRLRDWILILFTYWHGFRASEPLTVTEADFDRRRGAVRVARQSQGLPTKDLCIPPTQPRQSGVSLVVERRIGSAAPAVPCGSAVPGSNGTTVTANAGLTVEDTRMHNKG